MRQDDQEREPIRAARSRMHDRAGSAADDGVPATAEDQRIAASLDAGLGRLRTARPGFQDQLEQRLLARLAEPPRPWWRRFGSTRQQVRRPSPGIARLPRRSLLGLAAASALALTAASLSLPLIGTPEVSAREILEKVQANSENPGLAGVKSFHLTAKIWNAGGPRGLKPEGQTGPREMVTEQWFVAPDRMRTESRSQDANGKPIVSGFLMNGSEAKQYSTTGATDAFLISFFAAPIGGKAVPAPQTAAAGVAAPAGSPVAGTAVQVDRREVSDGKASTVIFAIKKPDGEAKPGEEQKDIIVMGENCPEPTRTGEATVAGRAVFVVENDFSSCLPADAPDELRGKHIRWVDQKTFLPLKMETYDVKGALVDRYEATSIEYDVTIPEKTFTELPPGMTVREPMMVPAFPATKGQFEPAKPATP
jgi:outer membrane lipoprotein-sorting protein